MEKSKEQENELNKQENHSEKLPYPKSIFFIFSNEFCERFSYYGMRTVLALYLQSYLGYSENLSTVMYHLFVMLCYFTPLIGGIVADSWLGKYKTIFYVSIIYAFGNIILSIGAVPHKGIPTVWFSLLGMFLIGSGTGGIKPCVSSFGGDQFILPQQAKQLESFFSIFYFSINAGSVLSCFFTPLLREVKCFGQNDCYSLAFGVPAILMVISIVCFVSGRSKYIIKKPDGNNDVLQVFSTIGHSIWRKMTSRSEKKDHWLDYADDKYSLKQINDTKLFMKIVYLFSPTIIFWALYEQQGSRWTFQASHMDGRFLSWVVQPDQMQTLNAVLVLVFIPIFDRMIYPCCAKLKIIRTPLQKLTWGGYLGALSFVIAGIVQLFMQKSYPVFPAPGAAQLRLYNGLNSNLSLFTPKFDCTIQAFSHYQNLNIPVNGSEMKLPITLVASNNTTLTTSLHLKNGKAASYFITGLHNTLDLHQLEINGYNEFKKLDSGNPKLKLIYGNILKRVSVTLSKSGESHIYHLHHGHHQTFWNNDTSTGIYTVSVNDGSTRLNLGKVNLEPGGIYVLMLIPNNSTWSYKLFIVTPPNNISMLWQIPQYILISFAEILFSITGIDFAYTQSPDSMKSVVSSLWLITDAFGNVIVLLIAGLEIFENQAYEFFLFAGMMVAVMIIFMLLAMRWTYVNIKGPENASEDTVAPKSN